MQNKDVYTIRELFDALPITIAELGRQTNINEVTLARIRDGKGTRRSTVNKLLMKMSELFNHPLSVANITGINYQGNKRIENQEARQNRAELAA